MKKFWFSSVSAWKLKCPSSAWLGTFTARACSSQKIPARTHLYSNGMAYKILSYKSCGVFLRLFWPKKDNLESKDLQFIKFYEKYLLSLEMLQLTETFWFSHGKKKKKTPSKGKHRKIVCTANRLKTSIPYSRES